MGAAEKLYEAGELYATVRSDKRRAALRSIESAQGALNDLDARLEKLIGWLEKYQAEDEHGGLTVPAESTPRRRM